MQDLFSFYLLDRSGSMSAIWDDTVGGLQQYVEEQAAAEGNAWITLGAFDDHGAVRSYGTVSSSTNFFNSKNSLLDVPFEAWNARDINIQKSLRDYSIAPRGMTPLLDAIGQGIRKAENLLAERPWFDGLVQFVIQTDGAENASTEFNKQQIKQLIEKKQAEGWQFLFMSAGVDAFSEAHAYGIPVSNAANYTSLNTRQAYAGVSGMTVSHRAGVQTSSLQDTIDNS